MHSAPRRAAFALFSLLCGSILTSPDCTAQTEHLPSGPWAEWVEPNFPFFSSTLDARKAGPDLPPNNLTPRGIILNLGHNCWACFDLDLLRIAAIWQGKGVTPEALAPLSYHDAGLKTLDGQTKLAVPDGKVWLANGIYPGWQIGQQASPIDPREPAPTPEEVGRGSLPPALGRFEAARLTRRGLCLEYRVGGTKIREWITASEQDGVPTVQRQFRVNPSWDQLQLVIAREVIAEGTHYPLTLQIAGGNEWVTIRETNGLRVVSMSMRSEEMEFSVTHSPRDNSPPPAALQIVADADQPATPRWPEEVTTRVALSTSKDAYVLDDIPLPTPNPWQRNVRLCDVQFFRDGRAAAVTYDGDVWTIRGLGGPSGEVQWRRFTSGLHEPMSLAIRDDEIFVYDRNGIWKLRDTDGNGEADVHELFSNAFAQTAETREFPSSMKLAPDGSFVISKGGQQSTTMGKHNGTVLRVAPDGCSITVLGWGFRGPFIGVHPRTGMVTASDQEGNYVPTTPLYIVAGATYHGFLSQLLPKQQYPAPIDDPLTWIPHPVNPSAVTQTWLVGAKMGPLNNSLIHFAYTRPEIFQVLLNQRAKMPQAAVVSLTHAVEFPLLNGAVNPVDGQLYVTGFRGWGTTAPRLAGLARMRYTGAPSLFPKEVAPMTEGVLVRFDTALDPARATDLASWSIERWNYQRTYKYGSPHLKLDGSPGQEWMQPSSAYLSKDGKAVFLGAPGMQPVMQMRVGWSLASREGATFDNNAYFTSYELAKFDPAAEGFAPLTVDLTPKAAAKPIAGPVSVDEGKRLYLFLGCLACHSTDGSLIGKVGPSWRGLFGSTRLFSDGTKALADEAYLKQAIIDPSAKVVKGFEKSESGMPNYGGVVTDTQLDSLILFIKTLGEPPPAAQ